MSSALPPVPFQIFGWNDPAFVAAAQQAQASAVAVHPSLNLRWVPLSAGHSAAIPPEDFFAPGVGEAIMRTVHEIRTRMFLFPPLPAPIPPAPPVMPSALPSPILAPAPAVSPSPEPSPAPAAALKAEVPTPPPAAPEPVKPPVFLTQAEHEEMMRKLGEPVHRRYGIFRAVLGQPSRHGRDRREPALPPQDLTLSQHASLAYFKGSLDLSNWGGPQGVTNERPAAPAASEMENERKTNKMSGPERSSSLVQKKLRAIDSIIGMRAAEKKSEAIEKALKILENQDGWENADFVEFFLSLQEKVSSFLITWSPPDLLNEWRQHIEKITLSKLGLEGLSPEDKKLALSFMQGCLDSDLSPTSRTALEGLCKDHLKKLDATFQSICFILIHLIRAELRAELIRSLGKK